jgi:hypothetical protein
MEPGHRIRGSVEQVKVMGICELGATSVLEPTGRRTIGEIERPRGLVCRDASRERSNGTAGCTLRQPLQHKYRGP